MSERRLPPLTVGDRLAALYGSLPEPRCHPHVPEERAERYSALDGASSELEVLDFLYALVRLFKPSRVLETGTWFGYATYALAAALERNGSGSLVTVDRDPVAPERARERARRLDPRVLARVEFVTASSLTFLERDAGEPFDMVFLDSDLRDRVRELRLLRERNRLTEGAICLVHDTSRHRSRYPSPHDEGLEEREELDILAARHEGFEFPFSRGFRLVRFCSEGEKRLIS